MRIVNYFDTAICEYALYSKGVSAAVACNDFHIKGAFAKINEKKILNRLAVPNNFILLRICTLEKLRIHIVDRGLSGVLFPLFVYI